MLLDNDTDAKMLRVAEEVVVRLRLLVIVVETPLRDTEAEADETPLRVIDGETVTKMLLDDDTEAKTVRLVEDETDGKPLRLVDDVIVGRKLLVEEAPIRETDGDTDMTLQRVLDGETVPG
jgi:hypothetical protein